MTWSLVISSHSLGIYGLVHYTLGSFECIHNILGVSSTLFPPRILWIHTRMRVRTCWSACDDTTSHHATACVCVLRVVWLGHIHIQTNINTQTQTNTHTQKKKMQTNKTKTHTHVHTHMTHAHTLTQTNVLHTHTLTNVAWCDVVSSHACPTCTDPHACMCLHNILSVSSNMVWSLVVSSHSLITYWLTHYTLGSLCDDCECAYHTLYSIILGVHS